MAESCLGGAVAKSSGKLVGDSFQFGTHHEVSENV